MSNPVGTAHAIYKKTHNFTFADPSGKNAHNLQISQFIQFYLSMHHRAAAVNHDKRIEIVLRDKDPGNHSAIGKLAFSFLQAHLELIPYNVTIAYDNLNHDTTRTKAQGTGLINYGKTSFIKNQLQQTLFANKASLDSNNFPGDQNIIDFGSKMFPNQFVNSLHEAVGQLPADNEIDVVKEAQHKILHETNRLYGQKEQEVFHRNPNIPPGNRLAGVICQATQSPTAGDAATKLIDSAKILSTNPAAKILVGSLLFLAGIAAIATIAVLATKAPPIIMLATMHPAALGGIAFGISALLTVGAGLFIDGVRDLGKHSKHNLGKLVDSQVENNHAARQEKPNLNKFGLFRRYTLPNPETRNAGHYTPLPAPSIK